MDETPKPLNLGEILDRTVNLYRSRFLVFFGISVLPTALLVAFGSIAGGGVAWWAYTAGRSIPQSARTVWVIVLVVLAVLIALPLIVGAAALANAALQHAVNRANFGEKVTIRDAYKTVWKRGWNYVGLYVLEGLAVWVVPFVVFFVIMGLVGAASALATKAGLGNSFVLVGLITLVGFAALFGYFIWMLLELSLAFPSCVIEEISPIDAMKRSWKLTKGTRGRIFLLCLLVLVLGWILSGGISVLGMIGEFAVQGVSKPQLRPALMVISVIVNYGAQLLAQALIKPIYGIALVLFYYDQRIRQEGFDIEWMMQRAGLVAPAPAPIAAEVAPVAPVMDSAPADEDSPSAPQAEGQSVESVEPAKPIDPAAPGQPPMVEGATGIGEEPT